MSCTVRLSRRALQDLVAIGRRIAVDRPNAAEETLRFIEHRLSELQDFPELGRARDDITPGIRSLKAERWLILYRADGKTVRISRIVDGARDLTGLSVPR